jgi:gluconate 5-dehydrogenase
MSLHEFDLSGKVALVTGAYHGLGFSIAQGLARAGASVVLNGRKKDLLDAAAKKLQDHNLPASTTVLDVTDGDAIRKGVRCQIRLKTIARQLPSKAVSDPILTALGIL